VALVSATLSALIRAKRLAANPALEAIDGAALTADCDAIAQAVVEHVVAAASVAVPALGLIAPPGAGGGPVTGAAIGTVS
jgi:hypothetical protein